MTTPTRPSLYRFRFALRPWQPNRWITDNGATLIVDNREPTVIATLEHTDHLLRRLTTRNRP